MITLGQPKPTLKDIYGDYMVSARLDSIDSQLLSLRILQATRDVKKGRVDLTNPTAQRLDETFLVSDVTVTKHLAGVKVTGRIVNTSSIIHESLTFNISMRGGNNYFWIPRISPGNSTAFSVHVEGVSVENTVGDWRAELRAATQPDSGPPWDSDRPWLRGPPPTTPTTSPTSVAWITYDHGSIRYDR
jgi:hypothetical protein